MIIFVRAALVIFYLLSIAGLASAQDSIKFRVTSERAIEQRLALHRRVYVDWETTFSITNQGQNDVIVFGMDLGNGRLDPVQYELLYDNKAHTWKYPNSDNAPTPWGDVSDVMKHQRVLAPGESLSFTRELSRIMRCGEKVMFTAQIGYPRSKRSLEIRSEEYVTPCLDKDVPLKPLTVLGGHFVLGQSLTIPISFEIDGTKIDTKPKVWFVVGSRQIKARVENGVLDVPTNVVQQDKFGVRVTLKGNEMSFTGLTHNDLNASWIIGIDNRPFEKDDVSLSYDYSGLSHVYLLHIKPIGDGHGWTLISRPSREGFK